MTVEKGTPPSSMFCRKCGYELVGLSENRCPECGRPFDPADRRTYLRHSKAWSRRRWLRSVLYSAIGMAMVVLIGAGVVLYATYSVWRAEQNVVAAWQAKGARAGYWPTDSRLLRLLFGYRTTYRNGRALVETSRSGGIFGARFAYLQDRVFSIEADLRGWLAAPIVPTSPVIDVRIVEVPVDDALLKQLGGLKELKYLFVASRQVTDAGVEALANVPKLSIGRLWCPNVTAAGLVRLRQAKPAVSAYNEPARGPLPGLSPLQMLGVPEFAPESTIAPPWKAAEESGPANGW